MFRNLRVGIVVAAIMAMTATFAVAGTAFYEDFDKYADGSQMHGQGGWKGWDNNPAWGAVVSTAQSVSPANSVAIAGDSDLVHEFDVVGGPWVFTAMQYVPSTSKGEPDSYFILLNVYEDSGAHNRWSVQSRADLDNGRFISDNGGGASTALVTDRWVELKYVIDLTANTVAEYYDGTLLVSYPWYDAADAAGYAHGAIEAVDLYGGSGASVVYYDNIKMVPEPTTVVLLLGAGLGLLAIRRRRPA